LISKKGCHMKKSGKELIVTLVPIHDNFSFSAEKQYLPAENMNSLYLKTVDYKLVNGMKCLIRDKNK
jgi:hypothetical protein